MNQLVRFCYRKIIDHASATAWERLVFEDSYAEFKMQVQRFNAGCTQSSFAAVLQFNPAAEQLHFLTSAAVLGYLKQLNGKLPDVYNTLGKPFLQFKNFRFEIINSDINDITKHRVAVNFYSVPVTWLHSLGNTMILSVTNAVENDELLTETFVMPPMVSIYSLKNADA